MSNPFLYGLVALLIVTSFKFYGCETVPCSDVAGKYEAEYSEYGYIERDHILVVQPNEKWDNYSAIVRTPQELRAALGQPATRCIIIVNDLRLRWYNGWEDGFFVADKVVRYTDVEVVGVLRNGHRPEIDFAGVQLLGKSLSLIELTLRLERLYLKNVAPIRKEALTVVFPGRVFINDSSIHIRGTQEDLAQIIIRPTEKIGTITAGGGMYESYSCPVDVMSIECPKGGLYVKNISLPLGWMGTSKGEAALSITKSVVTMERFQSRPVASPLELETYIGQTKVQGLLVQPLSPYALDMQQATSCDSPRPELVLDHDLLIDGRKGSPNFAFLNTNQAENCLTVGGGVTLQLQGVVVDDSAEEGRFKSNFLPFFKMEANSTVFLEGTVISVVPKADSLAIEDVEKEIESTFFNIGGVNITKMTVDDFVNTPRLLGSGFRDNNAPGLLVHNAALRKENGATYKLVHSLIIIDDSYFHKKHSLFLPIFIPLVLFLIFSSVVAIIAAKYKWKSKVVMFFQPLRNVSESDPRRRLLEERTVDEELKIMTKSSDDTHFGLHHEHQVVAEKLLDSLTLGNLIGRGGFGQVYKATWNGAVVAVKVIFHRENAACGDESAAREAALSANLRHPNVVQTFMQATRTLTESSDKALSAMSLGMDENPYIGIQDLYSNGTDPNSDSADQSPYRIPSVQHKETWLVQEHCDLGSLGQSIEMKLLHRGDKVDLNIVLLTCADIARGMEYLHSRNVIHGDLKCTNVLLCSSVQDSRGFVAKVADFGLSREMAVNVTHISTNTVGTLTHMPPELLRGGKLVPKGDVYSFGIMMWEILMGRSPFHGWTAPQLLRSVLNQKWRPTFPEFAPHGFNELGLQCLREHPEERPSFCEVLKRLEDLRQLAKS